MEKVYKIIQVCVLFLRGFLIFNFFFLEGDSTPIVFMYIVYTCIYEVTASMVSNNFIH